MPLRKKIRKIINIAESEAKKMTKSTTNNTRPALPKEDAALYRLLAVIAYAIIGFTLIIVAGKNYAAFSPVFRNGFYIAGMLVLFAALVFGTVYGITKKIKGRVFSLAGVCASVAPLVLAFGLYNELTRADAKLKIAFVALIFVLFMANLCPKIYTYVSGVTVLCAMSVYYNSISMGTFTQGAVRVLDVILKVLFYPMGFILPVAVVYAAVTAMKNDGRFKLGKIKIAFSKDKVVFIGLIVLMALLFASAVITLAFPALLPACEIAIAVVFAILGIICTIKVL